MQDVLIYILACFSLKIMDSRVLTLFRAGAEEEISSEKEAKKKARREAKKSRISSMPGKPPAQGEWRPFPTSASVRQLPSTSTLSTSQYLTVPTLTISL